MYNTTKCCRVVAAVGIERENVQCFFFFILALKVAWSERVDASYHSLTGFVSFFITNEKKSSQVEFRQMPLFRGLEATHYRCSKSGKKGCTKTCTFYTPAVPSRLVVLLQLSNELNVNFAF